MESEKNRGSLKEKIASHADVAKIATKKTWLLAENRVTENLSY